MPDKFESDTRKQLRKDYPNINWDEDEERPEVSAVAPEVKRRPSQASNYGAMMRLMTSKGDFETELEKFTKEQSTDETRRIGRERARRSLGMRGRE